MTMLNFMLNIQYLRNSQDPVVDGHFFEQNSITQLQTVMKASHVKLHVLEDKEPCS
jgi:hypothetical protein